MRVARSIRELEQACLAVENGIKRIDHDVQTIIKTVYGIIYVPGPIDHMLSRISRALGSHNDHLTGVATLRDTHHCFTSLKAKPTVTGVAPTKKNDNTETNRDDKKKKYMRGFDKGPVLSSVNKKSRFTWYIHDYNTLYAIFVNNVSAEQVVSIIYDPSSLWDLEPLVPLYRELMPTDLKYLGVSMKSYVRYIPNVLSEKNYKICRRCKVEFSSEVKAKAHMAEATCTPVENDIYADDMNSLMIAHKNPYNFVGWKHITSSDTMLLCHKRGGMIEVRERYYPSNRTRYNYKVEYVKCYALTDVNETVEIQNPVHPDYEKSIAKQCKYDMNSVCHHCLTPLYENIYVKLTNYTPYVGIAVCALCMHNKPHKYSKLSSLNTIKYLWPRSYTDVVQSIPDSPIHNESYKPILSLMAPGGAYNVYHISNGIEIISLQHNMDKTILVNIHITTYLQYRDIIEKTIGFCPNNIYQYYHIAF